MERHDVAIWERWGVGWGWVGWGGLVCEMARQKRWETSEMARWEICCFIQGWGTQGETNWVIIFLFLMLINKMKEHDEFKIFLCGRGDGEIFHPWN